MDLSAPSGPATASDLTVSDVVVNFQGLRAINGVSLHLRRGEVLGLIGPNGAGKTTLVNVLTGFQAVDSGTVQLAGEDIARWKPHERSRRGLVRTFQSVLPFGGLTALENVEAGAMATGAPRKAAREVGLPGARLPRPRRQGAAPRRYPAVRRRAARRDRPRHRDEAALPADGRAGRRPERCRMRRAEGRDRRHPDDRSNAASC